MSAIKLPLRRMLDYVARRIGLSDEVTWQKTSVLNSGQSGI